MLCSLNIAFIALKQKFRKLFWYYYKTKILYIFPNTCSGFIVDIYIFSHSVLRVDLEYQVLGSNALPYWRYAHFSLNLLNFDLTEKLVFYAFIIIVFSFNDEPKWWPNRYLKKVDLSPRRAVFGPKTLYWNCTLNTEW